MFSMIPFERKNNGVQKKYDSIFDMDRVFENFFLMTHYFRLSTAIADK